MELRKGGVMEEKAAEKEQSSSNPLGKGREGEEKHEGQEPFLLD